MTLGQADRNCTDSTTEVFHSMLPFNVHGWRLQPRSLSPPLLPITSLAL